MIQNFKKTLETNQRNYNLFKHDTKLPTPPNEYEKYLYQNGGFVLYSIVALITTGLAIFASLIWISHDKDRWPFLITLSIFTLFNILTYIGALNPNKFNLNKHNISKSKFLQTLTIANAPTVDIYLPTCGENFEVLRNAYNYVSQLQWIGNLNIFVLDDKGDKLVEELAKSYNFNYISRPTPGELKKAGNLRYAFTQTNGDYFVIFDADFCPRSDFLFETMHIFANDNRVGLLQTPQYFHLTNQSNYIEIGSSGKEELFYRCIQPSRDSYNGAMCVGTNAIYKREALTKMGGVAPIEHSEDIHTGFNLLSEGWKIRYIPIILAKGMAPDNVNAYFSQQYRWGLGTLMQIFDKNFWFAKIPFLVKLQYFNSIMYYLNVSTGVIFNVFPIVLSVMFYANEIKIDEVLLFLPFFIFTYIFHPLWQKNPWNFKTISANIIANTAYLFALFDLITGSVMEWVPTGQSVNKNSKKMRYYQFIWFLAIWHIVGYLVILYFVLMNMISWDDYKFYPILMFDLFYLASVVAIFEPINKLKSLINSILSMMGIRLLLQQVSAISSILLLLIGFGTLTVLAANKESRNSLIKQISNINFQRNTTNSIIPILSITNNPGENDKEINKKSIQADLNNTKELVKTQSSSSSSISSYSVAPKSPAIVESKPSPVSSSAAAISSAQTSTASEAASSAQSLPSSAKAVVLPLVNKP
jgi:cellulose synthase (UDP-forming)